MAREFSRTARVAENLRRSLAPLVDAAARDIGVGMATITEVTVSADLRHAHVYVSLYCEQAVRKTAIDALNRRVRHMRAELAATLPLRRMPALRFELDDSIERAARLTRLIDEAAGDPSDA